MFIKRTTKTVNGIPYHNYLLVQSVRTKEGPRQKTVCSLGNLAPGPPEKWRDMAQRVESAVSGQLQIKSDPIIDRMVQMARKAGVLDPQDEQKLLEEQKQNEPDQWVKVDTASLRLDDACEAGPVHVAHQMWKKLELDDVLEAANLPERAKRLTEIEVINRLVEPGSEHSVRNWVSRTALPDIFREDMPPINDTALYRNLDKLHPEREKIEQTLAEKEITLFNLRSTIFLYDLTSTYFEGLCAQNTKAKHGYSRDKRSDCRQVVVGLTLNGDGFPTAHEIFDGNRVDCTTVEDMLTTLDKRTGNGKGHTVVVDRGMSGKENLAAIKAKGHHYIVASRQPEREQYLADFECEQDWEEVIRDVSPNNEYQKKSSVTIKRMDKDDETIILCLSEGRAKKDRAIREKKEKLLLADLEKLQKRIGAGNLVQEKLIHEQIGRLKERYPRVARYYDITFNSKAGKLAWIEDKQQKEKAQRLDGGYLLKTDRNDLSNSEIWQTYLMLTRVENAFRDMKGPLAIRPVFHQLDRRAETHIFICILAYHLLVAIEKLLQGAGIFSSWETIKKELSTHQIVTASMKVDNGSVLLIRQATNPNPAQEVIYEALKVPAQVIKPVRFWCDPEPAPADPLSLAADHEVALVGTN
jgi:transposase